MTHAIASISKYAFLFITSLFVMTSTFAFGLEDPQVGQKTHQFTDPSRHRTLSTYIWYPAQKTIKAQSLGKGFFQPVIAAPNAPLINQQKKFPVVLLSHGSGGKADKLFWLTEQLVKNNYVVIAVDHVGNTAGDSSGRGLIEVWERPKDLTFVFNKVLELPEFKESLDATKVAAIGHSAGGATALLLGGAKFSPENFQSPVPHCMGTKDPYFAAWCTEIQNLDLKSYKKEITGGDYSDSRVTAVIGLDPGFVKSFDLASLKKINKRTFVFIADKLFTPFDEIHSKDFIKILGQEHCEIVPESVHMSFIQACKPNFLKNDPGVRELCAQNELKLKIQAKVAAKTVSLLKSLL